VPVVTTDGEKLKHILQNLINNAIKFTEKGQITVAARHIHEDDFIQFTVVDTGIGISEESLPVIFERFRQLDSSETRNHGGVGIGLYIVKQFTELLGGTVDVESEFGKGSTFTITIPRGVKIEKAGVLPTSTSGSIASNYRSPTIGI
jgi:signal transduction histidine kinase